MLVDMITHTIVKECKYLLCNRDSKDPNVLCDMHCTLHNTECYGFDGCMDMHDIDKVIFIKEEMAMDYLPTADDIHEMLIDINDYNDAMGIECGDAFDNWYNQ